MSISVLIFVILDCRNKESSVKRSVKMGSEIINRIAYEVSNKITSWNK